MQRRAALLAPWLSAPLWAPTRAQAGATPRVLPAEPVERLATAWRLGAEAGGGADAGHQVGVLRIDWAAGEVQLQAQVNVPSRAHGLLALGDGGFLALANRPGRWLLRCDAHGQLVQLKDLADERAQRTLNGHAAASADGHWLFTTETDPTTGDGWLSVRDARTLTRVAQFESHGIDPHQLLWASDGALMVANGGIARDTLGRKLDGETMAPSLVRIDAASGRLLGRWTLPDTRLSLRHLAWSTGPERLLGVALQSEHAAPAERAAAPTLAVWDGRTLSLPSTDARGGGYAGDIAAGPGGGFVISAQKHGRGLWWQPALPEALTLVAEISEPCALVVWPDGQGVTLSAGRGVARWHAQLPPRMLRWPVALAPDNHGVRLSSDSLSPGRPAGSLNVSAWLATPRVARPGPAARDRPPAA